MKSEDPQAPQMPDPVENDSTPGAAHSQPPEPSQAPARDEAEEAAIARAVASLEDEAADGGNYTTEIREQMRSEGFVRRTAGLVRRLTGSLRRMTGPLSAPTAPLTPPAPPAEQPKPAEPPDRPAALTGQLDPARAEAPAEPVQGEQESYPDLPQRQMTGPLPELPHEPLQTEQPIKLTGALSSFLPSEEDQAEEFHEDLTQRQMTGPLPQPRPEPEPEDQPFKLTGKLESPLFVEEDAEDFFAEPAQRQLTGPLTLPEGDQPFEQPVTPVEIEETSLEDDFLSARLGASAEPVENPPGWSTAADSRDPVIPVFDGPEETPFDAPGALSDLSLPDAPDEEGGGSGWMTMMRQENGGENPPEPLPSMPPAEPIEPASLPQPAPIQVTPPQPEASPSAAKEDGGDYMSEIRQTLRSEGGDQKAGGLIRRITSSLRRVTGPLRKITGPLPQPAPAPEQPAPAEDLPRQSVTPTEMADAFLTDRLSGAPAAEPAAPLPLKKVEDNGFPENFFAEPPEEDQTSLKYIFGGSEEAQLDTSRVLSDLGMPDQPDTEAEDPDWIAELRGTNAEEPPQQKLESPTLPAQPEPETPPQEPPAEKTVTRGSGALSFITGILRRSDDRRKPRQTGSLSDEMLTGRLERSLGTAPIEPKEPEIPQPGEPVPFDRLFPEDAEPSETPLDLLEQTAPDRAETPPGWTTLEEQAPILDSAPMFNEGEFVVDDDADLLEGLESRFGQFGEAEEEPLPGLREETGMPEISVEEMLWGSDQSAEGTPRNGPTFTPEDVWGEEELPAADQPGPRAAGMSRADALAASFLTGEDIVPIDDDTLFSNDQLLREALEKSSAEDEITSFEEMRAIALQGYQETDLPAEYPSIEGAPAGQTEPEEGETEGTEAEDAEAEKARLAAAEATAAAVAAFEREEEEGAPFSLRRWLAKRTLVQKFLLAEAALVALAIVIAVPFFMYLIFRGPVQKEAVSNYASPRALPADLPYPTGLQLPGGWYFQLAKSTFEKGKWTPKTSEWLEGTELRRVVALPWNPQTQAVINTFQEGDTVLLGLSNGETVQYTVSSIERVTANNTQILEERSPSLVIILYQEKATERWVVTCKP